MSRRGKKLKQIDEQIIVEPKFYVHYLQDGTIISSNNHRDEKYELAVEITYDQHHRLVTGLDKFLDFRVSTVIDENGNPVINGAFTIGNQDFRKEDLFFDFLERFFYAQHNYDRNSFPICRKKIENVYESPNELFFYYLKNEHIPDRQ